jgi:hypothetical protein
MFENNQTYECYDQVCETSTLYTSGGNTYPTSPLNVIAEDGFNTVNYFQPSSWRHSEENMYTTLQLIANNGLKFLGFANEWFLPNTPCTDGNCGGINIYNNYLIGEDNEFTWNDPKAVNKARTNYELMSEYAYKSDLSDVIWGHDINGEGSYAHAWNITTNPLQCYSDSPVYVNSEVPPANVSQAIYDFRSNLLTDNQKICISIANHGGTINDYTDDFEYVNDSAFQNTPDYDPQQYLELTNKPDVIIEGSYYGFPEDTWLEYDYDSIAYGKGHYLGKFKTIDYIQEKGYDNIQAFITGELVGTKYPEYRKHYQTDSTIANANWIWFQSYTSIIHGAKGVWIYCHDDYDTTSVEVNNDYYQKNGFELNRYTRNYFSNSYKNFFSNLGRELRYLLNEGFLSSDPNSIVYTKKDESDKYCIVPEASSYIPSTYNNIDLSEHKNENYGLRYTIRTNGDELIMIISNPLNIPITATLDFSNVSNPILQNAYGVDLLFEEYTSVTDSTYKVNRNSDINLENGTVGEKWYKAFSSGKELELSFGPCDVHILKFRTNQQTINTDGWEKVWTNNGSGIIGDWTSKDYDKYIPGDLDGDDVEELLCIQGGDFNNWATVLHYEDENWIKDLSNNGNNAIGGWWITGTDKFICGDFDGDSSDELLCIEGDDDSGNWATMLHYENGSWISGLSNNGNNTIGGWTIKENDKFICGDLDGDTIDELLCIQGDNDFGNKATILKFENNSWSPIWTNGGGNQIANWNIRQADRFFTSDFMNDSTSQLLCVQGDDVESTLLSYDLSDGWQVEWSNEGGSFNGWSTPVSLTDKILVGNVDYSDSRDEIMFLQTESAASWSVSMDLTGSQGDWNWNWNWGTNPLNAYLYDWPIATGSGLSTDYFLIKAVENQPKYLMAIRKFGCSVDTYSYLIGLYKSLFSANKSASLAELDVSEGSIECGVMGEMSIFPNPNSGIFTVLLPTSAISSQLTVYNSLGTLIRQKTIDPILGENKRISMELELLNPGVYFISWRCNDETQTKRFVINR